MRSKVIFKILLIVNAVVVVIIGMLNVATVPNTRILTEKSKTTTTTPLQSEPMPLRSLRSNFELITDEQPTKTIAQIMMVEPTNDFPLDDASFDVLPEELVSEEVKPKSVQSTRSELMLFKEPELNEEMHSETYEFVDPSLANQLLAVLDQPIKKPEIMNELDQYTYVKQYSKYHYGLTTNDDYCAKHREHFTHHPEIIFDEVNIYTDLFENTLMRKKIVPALGNESMPHIGAHMNKEEKSQLTYDLNVNISLFYSDYLFWSREITKQFSCLTQQSNHIPGHDLIYRKDYAAEAIREYKQKYINMPQCIQQDKFFPKTWTLADKDQCEDFFDIFNSFEYQQLKEQKGPAYIRKIGAGAHAAKGVAVVNQTEEDSLRDLYANGALCGKINRNYLMQEMVMNPLLLNGHKFDFRVFMLVASTNPTMVYFYRHAVVWASTSKYGENTADKAGFITNAAFNQTVIDTVLSNGTFNGMNFKELKDFATQTLEEVEARLLKSGQITDSNWLNNYLRPELRKALAHVIRMGQAPFLRTSSIYEIMGVDFMLDDQMNLWFIEANIYPSFIEYSKKESQVLNGMLRDHFEIVQGLLKSRTKRIINYINFLTKEGKGWVDGNGISFDDFKLRSKEFKEISKNYFEPEFEPSPTNGFELVANENLDDIGRYAGLIPTECF